MRGKHSRQFRRLSVAIRYGVILAVSGSIAAGVVLAAGHPRQARIQPLAQAEPTPAAARLRATVAAGAAGRTAAPTASQASASAPASPSAHATVAAGICTSPSAADHALAARMSRGILAAAHGAPDVGLAVADTRTGVSCELHPGWHFASASIAKVIILAALLHELTARHGGLNAGQAGLAREMITESDNAAANTLWDEVGRANLQRFLNLAGMMHTTLGPGILWGLTQATAPDELRLLTVLTSANPVLDRASREYVLQLMAQVIPAQRWGVPAGAEPGVTVHVKNGWLPNPQLWVVNSIGAFTSDDGVYKIVVLSQDNPALSDGIALVQGIATVVNQALAPR
ncbi:MAG TPA: serine hydrolase [Streptosporangiaceae bacterium]|nr:serine hydrolase [Streptosporangiaceae bacterium]